MTRSKRASHTRPTNPVRPISRIYAHTTPNCSSGPRYQRHHHLKQKHNRKLRTSEGDPEDTYLSFLHGIHDTEDDDKASSDGTNIDGRSDDQEWDEETTLVEILGSPAHGEEQVLQALDRSFADASRGLREEVVLSLHSVLRNARDARPAPGRAFITGLLGFDDACKHFEESSYQNNELNAAYAKIEVDIGELFEKLQAAYSRLEEKRAIFQKQVKEQTNKMREIINALPADVEVLLARLEKKYKDPDMDDGSMSKKKGRERTIGGALAELQL